MVQRPAPLIVSPLRSSGNGGSRSPSLSASLKHSATPYNATYPNSPPKSSMLKRMKSGDLALCRSSFSPEAGQHECRMPTVSPLPAGLFQGTLDAEHMPVAAGLYLKTLPESPYRKQVKPRKPASRWCDREDEPGWPGHDFKPRVSPLNGLVTPSSTMCTPVHERTRPIFYHPLTGARPRFDFTSTPPREPSSMSSEHHRTSHRPQSAPSPVCHMDPQQYQLTDSEVEKYRRLVGLLASLDQVERMDLAQALLKDAKDTKRLRDM